MSYLSEFVDRNTKDLQNLGGGKSSGGGSLISNPLAGISTSALQSVADSLSNIPTPNLDQNFAEPVQPLIDAAVDVTTTVPVQAVEGLTSIDAGKTATDVVTQTVKAPEQIIGDAEPAVSSVANATADTITTVTKVPEKINQIDAGKAAEDVANEAVNLVTETPKMIVSVAEEALLKPASSLLMYGTEEAKNAAELAWNNLIDPFQPGETEGNPAAAQPPSADLDAKDFEGNEDPFGNIETATTKADKLTEEERLRRIRRLMLNRYGREDTILTGAKDPFNRRRYARSL
jgi:hypothetical protein